MWRVYLRTNPIDTSTLARAAVDDMIATRTPGSDIFDLSLHTHPGSDVR